LIESESTIKLIRKLNAPGFYEVGTNLNDSAQYPAVQQLISALNLATQSGTQVTVEITGHMGGSSNSYVSWRTTVNPVRDSNNRITAVLAFCTDISTTTHTEECVDQTQIDDQQLEEPKRELGATSDLVVMHELRTPLHVITLAAQMLQHTSLNDNQNQLLNQLEASSLSLNSMISDILDFNRVDAGKLVLAQVRFNVRQAVTDVFDSFETLAREKHNLMKWAFYRTLSHWSISEPSN
jgi:signal transduction histidine kinase